MYTAKVIFKEQRKLVMVRFFDRKNLPFDTKGLLEQEIKHKIMKLVQFYLIHEAIHTLDNCVIEISSFDIEDRRLRPDLSGLQKWTFKNMKKEDNENK